MPKCFNAASAKKMCHDILLKKLNGKKLPLVLLDADVFHFTEGIFEVGVETLKLERILATSPEFDYDQNLLEFKYPVLKFIFDMRRDLDVLAVNEEANYNEQMTYGMCTFINSSLVLNIGGTKPSTWEDGFLTNDLRRYSGARIEKDHYIYLKGSYPIFPLSIRNKFVNVNSQRERDALSIGGGAFSRWSDGDIHDEVSTLSRGLAFDENKLCPEFSEFIPKNITAALNGAWLFMYNFRETDEVKIGPKEINHSKRLLRVLKNYGIRVAKAKVDTINNSLYDIDKLEGEFMIRRIDEIEIINY